MKTPKTDRRAAPRNGIALRPRSTPANTRERRSRILILNDHEIVRLGLVTLINSEPDLVVCLHCAQAGAVANIDCPVHPDLVICDLPSPDSRGASQVNAIHLRFPTVPLLVFSMHAERLNAENVLCAGARGYLMKNASQNTILQAIRRVLGGDVYLSAAMLSQVFDDCLAHRLGADSPHDRLSARELEVLNWIGQGKPTSEISTRLGVSPKTIARHRSNIQQKLQLDGRIALLKYALCWCEEERFRARMS